VKVRFKLRGGHWLATVVLAATMATPATLALLSPVAEASSGMSRIDFQPASGPVGTTVDMDITIFPPPATQQNVVLAAEPWDATPACAVSKPFPGMQPISMSDHATAHVIWPATFGPGQYRVCALAASDGHMLSSSFYPFTVTDPSVPTPTPPPTTVPSPVTSPVAVVVGQTDNITPGSDIHISIAHWFSSVSGGDGTIRVGLLSADVAVDGPLALTATTISAFSIASQPPDGLVLTLTLPPDTTPGSYRVVIIEKGGLVAATPPFPVVSAATTPLLGSQGHGYSPGFTPVSSGPTPLALLVAGMLALAVLLLAGPALARRLRR
jgi:hypothetical protein